MKISTINLLIANIMAMIILIFSCDLAMAGQTVYAPGTYTRDVYGNGDKSEGEASSLSYLLDHNGNTLNFSGTAPYYNVYGSAVITNGALTSSGNTLNVTGSGTLRHVYGAYAQASSGDVTVTGNQVEISGGGIYDNAYGGYVERATPARSSADDNSITVSGGEVNFNVIGGASYEAKSGTANDNTVAIKGGLIHNDVIGGASVDCSTTCEANGNAVVISGGEIWVAVYGGHVWSTNGTVNGTATGNAVTISNSPNLSKAKLYGGFVAVNGARDAFAGNTLNIKTSNLTVAGIENFEYLNFYLPGSLTNGGIVVSVDGTAVVDRATVNVGVEGSSSPLRVGDEVILIQATDLLSGTVANQTADGQGMQGVSLAYEFSLSATPTQLKALVTKVSGLNEGLKSLAEGFSASLGLLVGADGLPEAAVDFEAPVWRIFSAFAGLRERLKTGSHVDLTGFSGSLGVARRFRPGPVEVVAGVFLEYGTGAYDTYNDFEDGAVVRGEGDLRYFGGGALVAIDRLAAGPGHFKFELSGRVGGVENEFSSRDLRAVDGTIASYRTTTGYYGFGLGASYRFGLGETASAELHARWAFMRQKGKAARLSTGEVVVFEDADSSRLKAGVRVWKTLGEKVELYAGAAWENELAGAVKSSVLGLSIDPPTMRGHTGVGEAGLRLKPTAGGPFSLDLGVEGRVGQRRGLSGHLAFKLEF